MSIPVEEGSIGKAVVAILDDADELGIRLEQKKIYSKTSLVQSEKGTDVSRTSDLTIHLTILSWFQQVNSSLQLSLA